MKVLREARTRTAIWRLCDDGIARGEMLPGFEQRLEDAEENIAAIASLTEAGQRVRLIVDLSHTRAMNRDARVYYAGPESAKYISAVALVVGTPLSRALGNFFVGLNKPRMPLKLFGSDSEAAAWLTSTR